MSSPALAKTTTTTTGTSDYVLDTSALTTAHRTPKQAVADGSLVDGKTILYIVRDTTITGDASFELGRGTYTDSTNTVTRTAGNVLDGSNGPGVLVSWPGSGTRDFYILEMTARIDDDVTFNYDSDDHDIKVKGQTDDNLLVCDASSDNVGIGTATPGTKLEVVGNITIVQDGGTPGTDELVISHDGNNANLTPASGQVRIIDELLVDDRAIINDQGNATGDLLVKDSGSNLLLHCDASTSRVGIAKNNPLSLVHIGTPDEELEIVDATSTSTTEQAAIKVEVGGVEGWIRVFATK